MFWAWSFFMVERTPVFLPCAQETRNLRSSMWNRVKQRLTGGRLIFYVTDADALWNHLKHRGFNPEIPRDASWGERYFHVSDPDGHELSFARPLR
jgi:uncharacterized glyoxalase superfamily protein PhnB